MKKKICIVTGTRADYGIFYPLLSTLKECENVQLQILATGMHLSPDYGYTYKEIENDGFTIDQKVEIPLTDDTEAGIAKSIGHAIIDITEALQRISPNLVVLLGDRFETFAAAVAAFMLKIPVAHLYGGELTEGAYDDSLRHAITKFSMLHFTSTNEYSQRVVQLGESPDRVYNVGYLNVDNIKNTNFVSRESLESEMKFRLGAVNAIVTFHPVTLEGNTSEAQLKQLFAALDDFEQMRIIFTKPNADANGKIISRMIDDYVMANPTRCAAFKSLGRLNYLSLLKHVDVVIGNSSSGISEVPLFGRPTVNIGDRQKGRIRAQSVIDCGPVKDLIVCAIDKALSDEFRKLCRTVESPFGDGTAARKIVNILLERLSDLNMRKSFYDLPSKAV